MSEIINEYLRHIKEKNFSENTVQAYTRDIIKFQRFLTEKNLEVEAVEEITLTTFVRELNRLGKSEASIVRNIICIRNLYKYMAIRGIISKISLMQYEIPKFNRSLPSVLTVEEVEKLISAPDINFNKGKRDRAMLEVMYGTGIKVSELLQLKLSDVNLKLNYLICNGLRQRERVIPMGSYAVKFLVDYLEVRNSFLDSNKEDWVFLNSYGSKMSRQGFWKIIKAYAKTSGIDKSITVNTLRHSFAVHLIENGADLKSIQEFLGYKDIGATQLYINLAESNKLGEVYRKAHPRA